jgi:FkbM family methyltransferase
LLSADETLPDSLTVRVAGRELRFDTRSLIAKQWFYPRYASGTPHEPPIVDWFIQRLSAETQFLDLGANVGFYTVLVSAFCPRGRVIAVDVDPRLICEVLSNVAANAFTHAEAICGAAWDSDGEILAFEPEQTGNLSTNRIVSQAAGTTIGCVSFKVDAMCRQLDFHPAAAKVDVEGAEAHVLRGMTETLQGLSLLLLEIHPARLAAAGQQVGEIHAVLEGVGFACWLVENHRGRARMRRLESEADWQAISENGMILCEKQVAS